MTVLKILSVAALSLASAASLPVASGQSPVIAVNQRPNANPAARPPLVSATALGDTALCQSILRHGADVNAADQFGITPLMQAAAGGEISTPNPLYYEGENGGGYGLKFLFTDHTNPVTPWTVPAPDLLPLLLSHGARVNDQDIYGRTALWWAVYVHNLPNATLLLAHQANPNLACVKLTPDETFLDATSPLLLALGTNQIDLAKLLLDHGADPNAHPSALEGQSDDGNMTLLDAASLLNSPEMMHLLLAHGADPNEPDEENRTLLMRVVDQENTDAVSELLAAHANVDWQDDYGKTALIYAVRRGFLAGVSAILAQHPKIDLVDHDGWTALRYAQGNTTLVDELLNKGASPNGAEEGADGISPLRWACITGDLASAKVLISHGANVNQADSLKITILMQTAASGAIDCVQLLLDHGADVHARGMGNGTALDWAATFLHNANAVPVVELLLSRGAELDAHDKFGNTALTLAAANGNLDAVKTLLAHEPKESITGKIGQQALKDAVKNHHPDIAQLLRSAGVSE